MKIKALVIDYLFILLGSILYAISKLIFIFPCGLVLGGTSGISMILTEILPFSPGIILTMINFSLIILAFCLLGKDMAIKTLVGSVLTTAFIGIFEKPLTFDAPLVDNSYLSSLIGSVIIAVASGIMFYVDSSSGGTDIIALIVKKFSHIQIGKALLITDILIVLVGGALLGMTILLASVLGLLVKSLGIDFVISSIKKLQSQRNAEEENPL